MSDITELYQEMIKDHSRNPRNCRLQEHASCTADGHNPLCGDRVTVYLTLEGDKITDASFQGAGCAISTASASLMTESVKGKTLEQANELFSRFQDVVTGEEGSDANSLGKLAVFQGVQQFPMRVKCATLAWHAALEAMKKP